MPSIPAIRVTQRSKEAPVATRMVGSCKAQRSGADPIKKVGSSFNTSFAIVVF
jgi:hypothetical protein